MSLDPWTALAHLLFALAAGALIGLERTYRGRAAGFRTYALVCFSSSMLMLAPSLPPEWLARGARGIMTTDPTRIVQGIMTGVGFLGAGVIIKEGFSVRGLTTAASIWATAAVGILIGSGLFIPGIVAGLLTVGVLSLFRALEDRVPTQRYVHVQIGFPRSSVLPEAALRELLKEHDFRIAEMSYDLDETIGCFMYEMILWTHSEENIRRLAQDLRELPSVNRCRISPSKD